MPAPVLQFKRGIFSNLPGLRAGEPGFTTDSYELYVGINSTTQENKFFGSHRYWTRETTTTGSGVNLVEGSSNGSDFITLAAPGTLAGITTYTFPASPTDGFFLKTNSTGTLEWASISSSASFGDATFTGITTFNGAINATAGLGVTGGSTFDDINVTGIGTINHLEYNSSTTSGISTVGELFVGTTQVLHDDGGLITLAGIQTVDATTIATLETLLSLDPNDFDTLNVTGIGTFGGLLDANAGLDVTGHTELNTLNVSGIATFSDELIVGTGVGITQFSSSVSTGTSTSSVPTSSAVIDFVNAGISSVFNSLDLEFGIDADTGGPSTVDTSQTLTISGTANEVDTAVSGQTITIGLPNDVVVGTSLSTPTVKTGAVQASDGTAAITITDVTGAVGISSNLTVGGDLFVNGSTTQINTNALTVEDRTIDLGIVNGTAPASATTWDLGILFNYFTDAAKKSAVVWEHDDSRFKFASVVGADTNGTTVDTPQLTVTTFAPIEIGQLWVTDCAGTSQVISCTGSTRNLENITVDAGMFV
jgi:hypothetical protein